MKKFEYTTKYLSEYTNLEAWLNEYGQKGWELVSVKHYSLYRENSKDAYIFKREVQEKEEKEEKEEKITSYVRLTYDPKLGLSLVEWLNKHINDNKWELITKEDNYTYIFKKL